MAALIRFGAAIFTSYSKSTTYTRVKIIANFVIILFTNLGFVCILITKSIAPHEHTHHVIDHIGQFHGNFRSYQAALEWVDSHSEVEIGLEIKDGEFTR